MNESVELELQLWKELGSRQLSPSHNRWHIDRTLEIASELALRHGADLRVVTAAAVLHDLGRSDPTKREDESTSLSVAQAESVLKSANLAPNEVSAVLKAIEDHDKPTALPSTVEGQVLKDADFLAGFGAWGILRICMWAGEAWGGVEQVRDRLEHRMPSRIEGLCFPESRQRAEKLSHFSRFFLSELDRPSGSQAIPRAWKYIVFEGISGTGKGTQVGLLSPQLENMGLRVKSIAEPTEMYKTLRTHWVNLGGSSEPDSVVQMFVLLATRYEQFRDLSSQLDDRTVLLGDRSYLSTLVYQRNDAFPSSLGGLIHSRFLPQPDLVFLFEADPETAHQRIKDRKKHGIYENIEAMREHHPLFREILKDLVPTDKLEIVSTNESTEDVAEVVWNRVRSTLDL